MEKMLKKTILIIMLIIIVLILIIYMIYLLKIKCDVQPKKYTQEPFGDELKISESYNYFLNNSEKYAIIPGLKQKAIPQGICYSSKYNLIIVSAYHYGKASSVLFLLNYDNGELLKTLILKNADNTNFIGHVGGVTTDNESLWITDNYKIYKYKLENLMQKKDMENVVFDDSADIKIKADFVTYHDGILWIGEYDYKNIYLTNKEHYIKTPDDNENKSILMGYKSLDNMDFEYPDYVISIPDRIQGLTFDNNNNFIFSRSFWSFQPSELSIYSNVLEEQGIDYNLNGNKIKLWYLYKEKEIKNIKLPPMSEGIVFINNSIYILFESYSNLYKYYTYDKLNYIMQLKSW